MGRNIVLTLFTASFSAKKIGSNLFAAGASVSCLSFDNQVAHSGHLTFLIFRKNPNFHSILCYCQELAPLFRIF
jgi:hypothetical protein